MSDDVNMILGRTQACEDGRKCAGHMTGNASTSRLPTYYSKDHVLIHPPSHLFSANLDRLQSRLQVLTALSITISKKHPIHMIAKRQSTYIHTSRRGRYGAITNIMPIIHYSSKEIALPRAPRVRRGEHHLNIMTQ